MISVDQLRLLALDATEAPGEPLAALEAQLIRLAVAVSVTSLDETAIQQAIGSAFEAGATPAQVQEISSLVSGLGVHSLMASSVAIIEKARAAGFVIDGELDVPRQKLWDRYVGNDPFWTGFEKELPGFLRSMLILSPDQFEAFFSYCAVPWKSGQVRAKVKELAAMACDATPAHRFLPGFKLHLANAVALGAGSLALDEALAIAAAAPLHAGTGRWASGG
ncbi:hypothetical protein [Rhizorhabdus wittichii]|uniref:hypothetical protein n=1 Tax=Rhizorhabdus wittichii TaxID=160791 RepID=UPI0003718165|nr:hypothetical protein [Rhizorhabdus wittichii]